jgi:HEPN domain-containing protein
MTNMDLAQSYLIKARKRLKILGVLLQEEDYSDVVREAQEIVELSLKGMLRSAGIEPPKFHGSRVRSIFLTLFLLSQSYNAAD